MASVTEGGAFQGSHYVNPRDQGLGAEDSRDASTTAADLAQAGKEKVKELGGITRDRVYQNVDHRKDEVVQGLHQLASTLESASRDIPSGMARGLVDNAVGFIHKASDRIENSTTEELLRDVQDGIRDRPGVFVAGCVALGFFAGRFLKI